MGALQGKVAVVTGSGRGIGRAIALRYAREGAAVVVTSRTAAQLDEVVASARLVGADALAVVADAATRDGARAPVDAALARHGRVDIVVSNVGGSVGPTSDPFATDDGTFEETLVLNLTSAWWTINAALPTMRDQGGGRVITIGSGTSRHTGGTVAYTSAKHGLVGLTRQLAAAGARHGITVNCLCPGWTNTSLVDFERIAARQGTTADEARRRAESESLQRRILEPEELGGMATLLASDDASGITGQVIGVDGGYKV
jgi:meso-butanediol dehydrogenase/(S,S)-butanediol dehydrogenase/diacetyl reductase